MTEERIHVKYVRIGDRVVDLHTVRQEHGERYPRPTFLCPDPDCGDPVKVCWGKKIDEPYLRRESKSCSYSVESNNHRVAKRLVVDTLNEKRVFPYLQLLVCGCKVERQVFCPEGCVAKEEVSLPDGGKADVAIVNAKSEVQSIVEICYTHRTEAREFPFVEFEADTVTRYVNEGGSLVSNIRKYKEPGCATCLKRAELDRQWNSLIREWRNRRFDSIYRKTSSVDCLKALQALKDFADANSDYSFDDFSKDYEEMKQKVTCEKEERERSVRERYMRAMTEAQLVPRDSERYARSLYMLWLRANQILEEMPELKPNTFDGALEKIREAACEERRAENKRLEDERQRLLSQAKAIRQNVASFRNEFKSHIFRLVALGKTWVSIDACGYTRFLAEMYVLIHDTPEFEVEYKFKDLLQRLSKKKALELGPLIGKYLQHE